MNADASIPASSWLHPAAVVGPSPIDGQGLFAARAITKGEVVLVLGGGTLTDAEVQATIDRGERYDGIALGSDLNLRIEPRDWPGIHGNHSCDPNLWMLGAVPLVARRDVERGGELTVDYALFTRSPAWHMECRCGAPSCRGVISGVDWRRQDLQDRYRGHFAPAVQALIEREACP